MNIIAITQKGLNKTENEDRIIIGKNLVADGLFWTANTPEIIAVADGVGGNCAGAIASHFVAKRLTSLDKISQEAFAEINQDLLTLSSSCPEYENMATTLSGIAIVDGIYCLFSIGNTRVYLLQSRKYLKQLTTDDTTLNYLLATGQLSAENANLIERKNEITACFGGGASHLFKIKFSTIDALTSPFMITSDGVHDYVPIDQIEEIIAEHGISIDTCKALIDAARSGGSQDDISIVLGEIQDGTQV